MKNTIAIGMICAALAGCATKQYVQVGMLSNDERTTMSCHDLDVEMARAKGVQQTLDQQDGFDVRSVLSFFGDFGVGNYMALSSAESGVRHRMSDLQDARVAKACGLPTQAAQLN